MEKIDQVSFFCMAEISPAFPQLAVPAVIQNEKSYVKQLFTTEGLLLPKSNISAVCIDIQIKDKEPTPLGFHGKVSGIKKADLGLPTLGQKRFLAKN